MQPPGRWLRHAAWVVAVLAVLVGAVFWGLPALLLSQLPPRLSEALGRPVTLQAVAFVPWRLALTLHGLRIGAAGDAAAAADPAGAADTALLDIGGAFNPTAQPLALDIRARATDLELAPLSPYAGKYAGYAIQRGKLSMDVSYKIDADGKLEASNQVRLTQFTFGERVVSPNATQLPVLLAVALLTDRSGVIDIILPVAGSVNDPKFSVGGIVWKVILNLTPSSRTACRPSAAANWCEPHPLARRWWWRHPRWPPRRRRPGRRPPPERCRPARCLPTTAAACSSGCTSRPRCPTNRAMPTACCATCRPPRWRPCCWPTSW